MKQRLLSMIAAHANCADTIYAVAKVLGMSNQSLYKWHNRLSNCNLKRLRNWGVQNNCTLLLDAIDEVLNPSETK
jgi:transposase-like protein